MDKSTYILEKASELYFEYGIKALTIDELSKQLAVSKKTIYRCFEDKEDMVEKAVVHYFDKKRIGYERLGDETTNAIDKSIKLRSYASEIFEAYNSKVFFDLKRVYPRIYTRLNDEKYHRITDVIEKLIAEGQKQGLFRIDMNINIIARLMAGDFLLTINPKYKFFTVAESLSDKLFDEMLTYNMHALCTSKGIQYFKKIKREKQNE